MSEIYQDKQLQERQNASLVLPSSAPAKGDVPVHSKNTKLNSACRSEITGGSARPNVGNHTVFVLDVKGKPLAPTTPAKARKLLKGGQAHKTWSKFNTFGIRMLVKTREETPDTCIGHDLGTKFEGFSIVVDKENNLNIKLDLPDKKKIVRKMRERREARRTRRSRLRRREERFNNRSKQGYIAPSQLVVILSRLKVIKELCLIYPVSSAAVEDIRFNHAKYRWGKNFSTMEIGKNKIRDWFRDKGIEIFEYRGFETQEVRKKYGYKKTSSKSADKFSSHCSDSLALAVNVNMGEYVAPGKFLVVDDTYRCIRRKLHYSNIKCGGTREKNSCGTVYHLQKGKIVGTKKAKTGQLCGENRGSFRYFDLEGKRRISKSLNWISNKFKIKEAGDSPFVTN